MRLGACPSALRLMDARVENEMKTNVLTFGRREALLLCLIAGGGCSSDRADAQSTSDTADDSTDPELMCSEDVVFEGDIYEGEPSGVPWNVKRITGTYYGPTLGTIRDNLACLERVGGILVGAGPHQTAVPHFVVDHTIEFGTGGVTAPYPQLIRGLQFADAPGVSATIRILDVYRDSDIEIDFISPRPLSLYANLFSYEQGLLRLEGENWPTEFIDLELGDGTDGILDASWLRTLERVEGDLIVSAFSSERFSLPALEEVGGTLSLTWVGAPALPKLTRVDRLELSELEYAPDESISLSPELRVASALVMTDIAGGRLDAPILVGEGADVTLTEIESASLLRVGAAGDLNSLILEANPGLVDLSEVLPPTTRVTGLLRVIDNPALDPCDVQAFAEGFAGPDATVEIPEAQNCLP